ncbi:MAG TPA: response regulator transcription factor [Steroidobacteraceae bacterium]|jgi:DNA-binding NarL/FixJ family response regulator|nr:response regulator transcription factor [Steroidobacteraceae bacterium]
MTEHGTRLIIIDDHPLVREGLKQLLAGQPDFQIAGEASNAAQARQLLSQTKPDVAVLDLTLGQDDGIELTKWIRENHPEVRILILSMQEEALYAERLLRLGVSAYVMKSAAETDFLNALRKVARGQRHLSAEMSERLLSKAARGQLASGDDDPVTALTHRELQVFQMIGGGVSTREIADQLQLSMKTIDAHRRHMREKLNLRSTSELMRYAARWVSGHPAKVDAPVE